MWLGGGGGWSVVLRLGGRRVRVYRRTGEKMEERIGRNGTATLRAGGGKPRSAQRLRRRGMEDAR